MRRKKKVKDLYGIVKLGEDLFGKKEKQSYRQTLEEESKQRTRTNLEKTESKFARGFFRVLIVNDKPEETAALVRLIRDELGFTTIKVATSIKEGLNNLVTEKPYDLVLSMYRTRSEDVDGYDLYKQIREWKKSPQFLIVDAYTAEERENLAKVGLVVLPFPPTQGQIAILINGFYVRKLQKIMDKML